MANNNPNQIYKNLQAKLDQAKPIYSKHSNRYSILVLILLFNMVILFYTAIKNESETVPIIIFIFNIPLMGYLLNYKHNISNLKNNIKNETIPIILNEINPTLSYIAKPEIKKYDLLEPKFSIFDNTDDIITEDMIMGLWHGHEFLFCEATLRTIHKGADEKTKLVSFFSGLFIKIDYHKKFNGITEIVTKKSPLDIYTRSKNPKILDLENDQFNKIFEVTSDDEIEARYILSLPFMEKIMKLKKDYDFPSLHIFFYDNYIYVLCGCYANLFEIDFKNDFSKETTVDPIINHLKLIDTICLTLNLNKK